MFDSLKKKLNSFIGKVEKEAESEEEEEVKAEEIDDVIESGPEPYTKPKTDFGEVIESKYELKPESKHGLEPQKKKRIELTRLTRVAHVFKNTVRLSENDLELILSDFQLELVQSDIAFETSREIIKELRKKLLDRDIPKDTIREYIQNALREVLLAIFESVGKGEEENVVNIIDAIRNAPKKPYKIIFLGVNGSGKTTTIAKFAHMLMKNNLSCVFAAGDTFRAGAIEQIEKHAEVLGVKLIKHQKGADSAAVIYDAIEHAKSKGIDAVLADSAGRAHTNANLMDEMKKIIRVNKPNLKVFVGDSLTGNDAVDQVRMFDGNIGIDAVILTKMDADPKGGCAISIVNTIKKPIIYVGVGQNYDDLKEFNKEWFVDNIIG